LLAEDRPLVFVFFSSISAEPIPNIISVFLLDHASGYNLARDNIKFSFLTFVPQIYEHVNMCAGNHLLGVSVQEPKAKG
jgi:hypothetical protein